MMRRRAFVLAMATLLGGALLAGPATPASAQSDERDKRKRKEKDEPKEKTAAEKELEAIGKDFRDKDVDALIARVPEDVGEGKEGRIRLRLGSNDGTYARTQAKRIIEEWLESREIKRVKLKSTKDLVGTFVLKGRRIGGKKDFERTLVIRIAGNEEDGFVLKVIEVQAQ